MWIFYYRFTQKHYRYISHSAFGLKTNPRRISFDTFPQYFLLEQEYPVYINSDLSALVSWLFQQIHR